MPALEYDLDVTLGDLDSLRRGGAGASMQPTGMGNPCAALPRHCAALENARRIGRDGAHLSLTFARDGGGRLRGVMFSAGARAEGSAQGRMRPAVFAPRQRLAGASGRGAGVQGHGTVGCARRIEAQRGQMGALVFHFLTEMLYNRGNTPRGRHFPPRRCARCFPHRRRGRCWWRRT